MSNPAWNAPDCRTPIYCRAQHVRGLSRCADHHAAEKRPRNCEPVSEERARRRSAAATHARLAPIDARAKPRCFWCCCPISIEPYDDRFGMPFCSRDCRSDSDHERRDALIRYEAAYNEAWDAPEREEWWIEIQCAGGPFVLLNRRTWDDKWAAIRGMWQAYDTMPLPLVERQGIVMRVQSRSLGR